MGGPQSTGQNHRGGPASYLSSSETASWYSLMPLGVMYPSSYNGSSFFCEEWIKGFLIQVVSLMGFVFRDFRRDGWVTGKGKGREAIVGENGGNLGFRVFISSEGFKGLGVHAFLKGSWC